MARDKPLPRNRRKPINRGLKRSRNNDKVKNISIGLMDIDSTIMFYFNNVIKPRVSENGSLVKVPIMYANPERWNQVQKNGFLYDNKQQLVIPLIAFKRTSIEKDAGMSVDKFNPQDPQLFYSFQKKYSNVNRYDKFSVQQGLNKSKELYKVAVPDYVKLSYDFVVWTSYTEQMNSIVEKLVYSEGAYWGEDGKFKFRTQIDNYTDASEININQERIIKTTFSVTLNGYLIPDEFNNKVTTEKSFSPKRVIFNLDTTYTPDELKKAKGKDSNPPVNPNFALSTTFPLKFVGGEGISITSDSAVGFDGSTPVTNTLSLGQHISTTSDVTFNELSVGQLVLGNPTTFGHNFISGSMHVTGSWNVGGDMSISGDAIIAGTLTVSDYHTKIVSSSFLLSSGSTKFGDSLDDRHRFTGSLSVTGSTFTLNQTTVTKIENDGGLITSSASPHKLITENALTQFTGSNYTRDVAIINYLRKNYYKISSGIVGVNTASFSAVTASAPTGYTSTTENDFIFFINGQYMEHDAISLKQNGSTLHLQVDTGSIGYSLEADDEIVSFGKFNS